MDKFKVISWNVRGLNSKFKRATVFQYIKAHKPHVLFLQETHLTGGKVMALKKPWVQRAYHATFSTYARGVSILFAKSFPVEILDVQSDRGEDT